MPRITEISECLFYNGLCYVKSALGWVGINAFRKGRKIIRNRRERTYTLFYILGCEVDCGDVKCVWKLGCAFRERFIIPQLPLVIFRVLYQRYCLDQIYQI